MAEDSFFEEYQQFSAAYDRTRVVLLPVEPYRVYAYWEVGRKDMIQAEKNLGRDFSSLEPVLRIYNLASSQSDEGETQDHSDIAVELQPGSCYVHLKHPEKSYYAELGLRTGDGEFLPLAGSNRAETPRAQPMPRQEDFEHPAHMPLNEPDKSRTNTDGETTGGAPAERIDAMAVIARCNALDPPDSGNRIAEFTAAANPVDTTCPAADGLSIEMALSAVDPGNPVKQDKVVDIKRASKKMKKRPGPDLVEVCEQIFITGISSTWQ